MQTHYTFCNMQPQEKRLCAAAQYLTEKGCTELPANRMSETDFLLLGQPFTAWDSLFQAQLPAPDTLLFAGRASASARVAAAAHNCPVIDYMQEESLLLQNAVLTAEGALALLLQAKDTALWGSSLLLVGYGRVAQALAVRLAPLGVRLTIAARREETRTLARMYGFATTDFTHLSPAATEATYLVNTVPAPALTREVLLSMPEGSFLLDLASAPGGVVPTPAQQQEICRQKNLTLCAAPGLPGKIAPQTAGTMIGQTVWQFLVRRQAEKSSSTRTIPKPQEEP